MDGRVGGRDAVTHFWHVLTLRGDVKNLHLQSFQEYIQSVYGYVQSVGARGGAVYRSFEQSVYRWTDVPGEVTPLQVSVTCRKPAGMHRIHQAGTRKLPGNGNSNSDGARPVH